MAGLNAMVRITSTHVENTEEEKKTQNVNKGSPPHTWRIHNNVTQRIIRVGITSTHVENTFANGFVEP